MHMATQVISIRHAHSLRPGLSWPWDPDQDAPRSGSTDAEAGTDEGMVAEVEPDTTNACTSELAIFAISRFIAPATHQATVRQRGNSTCSVQSNAHHMTRCVMLNRRIEADPEAGPRPQVLRSSKNGGG